MTSAVLNRRFTVSGSSTSTITGYTPHQYSVFEAQPFRRWALGAGRWALGCWRRGMADHHTRDHCGSGSRDRYPAGLGP